MGFEFPEQVVRLRREHVPHPYGGASQLADWADTDHPPKESVLSGCVIAPVDSSETNGESREQVREFRVLYGPFDIDLLPTDRVRDEAGMVYEVIGYPRRWRNPFTGDQEGAEVELRILTG